MSDTTKADEATEATPDRWAAHQRLVAARFEYDAALEEVVRAQVAHRAAVDDLCVTSEAERGAKDVVEQADAAYREALAIHCTTRGY